jgi:hypothetical protein
VDGGRGVVQLGVGDSFEEFSDSYAFHVGHFVSLFFSGRLASRCCVFRVTCFHSLRISWYIPVLCGVVCPIYWICCEGGDSHLGVVWTNCQHL